MKLYKLLLSLSVGLLALNVSAQNRTVTGTVTDGENGDPVPFASIVVKGTSNWTTTDIDGKYAVNAPSNGVLSVEILGYASLEVSVDGRSVVDIVLSPDLDQLSESVVIGYGVQQKKLLTGSTIQVKGDDLAKLNTTTALGALQSQSPGVTITQSSGQPGEGFKVNIRGMGTIGDSEPLYVIDGVAGGSLSALNPADIESIDVLKDAASAALYRAPRAQSGFLSRPHPPRPRPGRRPPPDHQAGQGRPRCPVLRRVLWQAVHRQDARPPERAGVHGCPGPDVQE